jgi:ATP-dependent RNA helicase RhlE
MLGTLAHAKYTKPTVIQGLAIPPAMQQRDVVGMAPTGTGKTAAFVIPMIERFAGGHGTRGLILSPTRELAMQIQQTVSLLGRSRRIEAALIVGGAGMPQQERAIRQQPDILVATPGRLLDHLWRGTLTLRTIKVLVLDEADRLLDMGFAPQLDDILAAIPEERQTLLFSATMPSDVAALAKTCLRNPARVEAAPVGTPAAKAQQRVYHASREQKNGLLRTLLKGDDGSTLIFTRTKSRADRVGRLLSDDGVRAAVLHGDRSTGQRREALEGFRRGKYRVLVATDIMARGIHVNGIAHVINYDIPNCPEDYIHRIGRTARGQAAGLASTFVTPEDRAQLKAIERLLGKVVPVAERVAVAC